MDQVITREKQDALTLRWLQLATDGSKKSYGNPGYKREPLSGLHVKNGKAEAADGYRIHQSVTPEPLEDFEGIVRVREGKGLHKTPGRVYKAEKVDGVFPDTRQIFPRGKPQSVIAIKAKYLREALDMPNLNPADMVVIKAYRSSHPVLVEAQDGKSRALVMPMKAWGDNDKEAKEADKQTEIVRLLEKEYPSVYAELEGKVK